MRASFAGAITMGTPRSGPRKHGLERVAQLCEHGGRGGLGNYYQSKNPNVPNFIGWGRGKGGCAGETRDGEKDAGGIGRRMRIVWRKADGYGGRQGKTGKQRGLYWPHKTKAYMASIDEVKRANRIEDVIAETQKLEHKGRELQGVDHDSLRVNVDEQSYYWFSREGQPGWSGDVITWAQYHVLNGSTHGDAIRWLCERAGLPFAVSAEEQAAYAQAKAKQDVLEIVTRLYAERLWKSDAAKAYVKWRGWNDATAVAARLGYSGGEKPRAERQAIVDEIKRAGLDPESPIAVSVLGYVGDVAAWARAHDVQADSAWLAKGEVRGIPNGHLVYAHVEGGKVVYISTRLADAEQKAHHNLHSALAGEKRVYINWLLRGNVDGAAIVEGQADAVTLGQWGMPALALAGVGAREAWLTKLENVRRRYAALDADETGQRKNGELAAALGPRTTYVVWPVKDANTLLQSAEGGEADGGQQTADIDWQDGESVRKWLNHQPTYVEWLAAQAGASLNGTKDDALIALAGQAAKLERQYWEIKKDALAKAAGVRVGALTQIVKAQKESASEEEDEAEEQPDDLPTIITNGMVLIHEHFVDLVYRPEFGKFMLAVRYPDGVLSVRNDVEIRGVRYVPPEPNELMQLEHTIIFPNGLNASGEPLPMKELHAQVMEFANRYFDADKQFQQVAAWYVILTWLYDCFPVIGYLRMVGPYGVGKSRFADTYGYVCYRAIRAAGSSSVSPVFRTLHLVRGTLVMDEINAPNKDTDPELEMVFKLGNSRRSPAILRTGGGKDKELFPEGFNVFGPKVFGAIKKFGDPATDSRCITWRSSMGTTRKDIPKALEAEFDEEAAALRKELMTMRMKYWDAARKLNYREVDETLEPRSQQIGAALFSLVDDVDTRAAITHMLFEQEAENRAEREMSVTAKALRAVAEIVAGPPKEHGTLRYWDLRLTVILNRVRELVFDDEDAGPALNSDGTVNGASPRNDKGHWVNRLSAKKLASTVKTDLGMRTDRASWHASKAYEVVLDDQAMRRLPALCRKYGVEWVGEASQPPSHLPPSANMGEGDRPPEPDVPPMADDEYLREVDE